MTASLVGRFEPVDLDGGVVEVAAGASVCAVQGDSHQVFDDGALAAQVYLVPHVGDIAGGEQFGEHVLACGVGEQVPDLAKAQVAAFGGGQQLRPADQSERAVGGQLIEVGANRGGLRCRRRAGSPSRRSRWNQAVSARAGRLAARP